MKARSQQKQQHNEPERNTATLLYLDLCQQNDEIKATIVHDKDVWAHADLVSLYEANEGEEPARVFIHYHQFLFVLITHHQADASPQYLKSYTTLASPCILASRRRSSLMEPTSLWNCLLYTSDAADE